MSENVLKCRFSVPESHSCFEGHFPGDPLVPGALMIQWLAELINKELPDIHLTGLKVMKFIAPVRPGDQCEVVIKVGKGKVMVECLCHDSPSLQGQFLLG